MGLLVLGEVDADQVGFAAVEGVGQGVGGLGLATPVGPGRRIRRPAWPGQLSPRDRLGCVLGDGAQGGLLAHHPLAHSLRQGTDGGLSSASILPTWMPVQLAITAGHGTRVHLLGNQRVVLAGWLRGPAARRQFEGQVVDATVQFSSAWPRRRFAEGQQFAAGVEQFAHPLRVPRPSGSPARGWSAVIARLAFQGGDTRVVVEAGGLFRRSRCNPLPAPARDGAGFPCGGGGTSCWLRATAQAVSEHADRLVRQLAAGDVAMRQLHRIDDGRVHDLHAVM